MKQLYTLYISLYSYEEADAINTNQMIYEAQ